MNKIKILFLAANPKSTDPLALDEEIRAIEQKIRATEHRDSLELISKWAVRPDDVIQALNEHKPHVVHFSGHGSEENEILLVGNNGEEKPVTASALRALFSTLKDNVRLVIFNACYARTQAEAVAEVIDCAIGMNKAIGDDAAIVFAGSFYRGLGFGRSLQEAFDQGKVAIMLEGIPEENTPELLVRENVDPTKIVLVEDSTADESARAVGNRSVSIGGNATGNVIVTGDGNRVGNSDPAESSAVAIWQEKLAFLQTQEAITADAAQKFALQQQIKEAQQKIDELS